MKLKEPCLLPVNTATKSFLWQREIGNTQRKWTEKLGCSRNRYTALSTIKQNTEIDPQGDVCIMR
jgi:hypothetical protein